MKFYANVGVLLMILIHGACTAPPDRTTEMETIRQTIKDSIGWALTKDQNLLYRIIANDADLLIMNPDGSRIEGFAAFQKEADTVWMNPKFKATRFEVKNLRVKLSRTGDVAWYDCLLDDFGEWDGQPVGWENVRWTGILEKRDGQWTLVQMHFSFPAVDR
jgi:ketosteroid isomerase-like protein